MNPQPRRKMLSDDQAFRQHQCSAISSTIDRHDHDPETGMAVSRSGRVRKSLLWAAAGAMVACGGLAVQAQSVAPQPQCTTSGTTVTCRGDLSAGVAVDGGDGTYTSLIIKDLSNDIEPPQGTGAIKFTSTDDDININLDTGNFEITSMNEGSYGILAYGNADVNISTTGGILTTGVNSTAIQATASRNGNIDLLINSNINTSGTNSGGILANADGGGNIRIEINSDIETSGNDSPAIFAKAVGNGDIKIVQNSSIDTSGNSWDDGSDGIHAISENGDIMINSKQNIIVRGKATEAISATSHNGNINIYLNDSFISAANGNAIQLVGGRNNTLVINGKTTIYGGGIYQDNDINYRGADLRAGDGDETIINSGQLTMPGLIDLGGGKNTFKNKPGALFNSGKLIILGQGNSFINWGIFSPGDDSGVQSTILNGNFVSVRNSDYNVTIEPTIKNGIKNDRLVVNGTAYLRGGKVRVSSSKADYSGRYVILTADDGVKGRFFEVVDTLFMDNELNYSDKAVTLSSRRKGVGFCHYARTANQRAVCGRFHRYADNNRNIGRSTARSGILSSLQTSTSTANTEPSGHHQSHTQLELALLNQTTTEGLRAALDDLSGEVHASLKGALVDAGQTTVAAINRRISETASHPGPHTTTAGFADLSSLVDDQSGLWVTGYNSSGAIDATSNASLVEVNPDGILLGIDHELSEHWRFGVLGGYGRTGVDQPARFSSALVDTWSLGMYGGAESGASSFSFGTIYSGHAIDTSRSVRIDTFSEQLSASYDARSWQFFTEAAQQIQTGNLMLEPFAGLSSISLHTDDFRETGGEEATLTALSDASRTTFTTLGVRSAIELYDMAQVHAMVGWRHAFGDRTPSSPLGTPNSTADRVMGAPIQEDALVTELGLEASIFNAAVLGVAYNGRYGDGTADHGFKADLELRF